MQKNLKTGAVAAAVLWVSIINVAWSAAKAVDVPLEDLRSQSAEEVRTKALRYAQDGIVVVYSGESAALPKMVSTVAGECAERGFQVKAVLIANTDERSGVVLYGHDGGPLGPLISSSGNVKSETAAQIEQLKNRLERVPNETAVIDPLDVVHCRKEPVVGSLVRKVKTCSTPREDAARTEASRKWTTDQQNQGGNEAMPGN